MCILYIRSQNIKHVRVSTDLHLWYVWVPTAAFSALSGEVSDLKLSKNVK